MCRKTVKSKRRLTAVCLIVCMLAASLCRYGVAELTDSTADTDSAVTAEAAETDIGLSQLLDMDELTGWASVSGYGTETVTGGGDATPQLVTTTEEFESAVSGDDPAVIVVSGTIEAVTSTGYGISIGSNKTIVGIDSDATLKGGIVIKDESNIIVSNLTLKGYVFGTKKPSDVVHIEGSDAHHIWLNHLDISDADDGNLDITSAANYITVSWCKFSYSYNATTLQTVYGVDSSKDHRLSCLISSGAGDHDEDYGHLKVTYHHNWFADNCDQRMPRVMYGKAHIYNNYYSCEDNSYCIGVDSYASVLIENNYFYNVNNPHQFSYPDSTLPATITARGNLYIGTSGDKDSGQKANTLGVVAAFENPLYSYWLDDAEDVPTLVTTYAGPQDYDPDATAVPTATPEASAEPTAEPTPQPTLTPTATPTPAATDAAPKLSYDSDIGTVYELQGQNSDGTNGQVVIENPFAGLDLSETPTYSGSYPSWKNGVTLTYWEYIPSGVSTEGVALNFYGTHRAVNALDWTLIEEEEEGYTNRFVDEDGNYTYSLIREGDVLSSLQISTYGSIGFSEDDCVSGWNVNPYSGEYGVTMAFQQKNYYYIFANTSGTKNMLLSDKGSWHFVALVIQNDGITTYIDGTQTSTTQYNVWGSASYTIAKYGMYVGGQAFNLGYGWKGAYRASSTSAVYSHGITLLDFLSLENTALTIGGGGMLWETLAMNDFTTPGGIKIGDVTGYTTILTASEIKTLANGGTIDTEPAESETPTASETPAESETAAATESEAASEAPAESELAEVSETPAESELAEASEAPAESEAAEASEAPAESETPAASEAPQQDGLLGDVNLDGSVTASDALLTLQYVVNLAELSETQQTLADVDYSEEVTAADALRILQYVVNLIETFS